MVESATLNRRERRKQDTAQMLTAVTRRLTADRGLAGFTIEEACEEVDISRRTFFNYFSSKEDAVVGINSADETQHFAEEFLAFGPSGWDAIVDQLVGLIARHFAEDDHDPVAHSDFMRALDREPRLLARFIGASRENERNAIALVATREGVEPTDPRAEAAVNVVATVLRTSIDHLLDPADERDYPTILTDSLAALRVVLTPSQS